MRRIPIVVPMAILVACLILRVAQAAPAPDPRALLQQVEADLRVIDNAQVVYGSPSSPQIIADISRYVALPGQLEEWRATARRAQARLDAGQIDAAAAELEPLARTTGAARQRAYDIIRYWPQRATLDRRLAQWQRFVDMNRIEPPQRKQIEAAVQGLDAAVSRAEFATAQSTLMPQLTALLDTGFAEGRTSALSVQRDDRFELARDVPCVAPVVPVTPDLSGRAKFDPERAQPTDGYFPPAARRDGREGRVAVEVYVDAGGCPTRAVALVSSGEPDIDLAALNWVIAGGAFRPAAEAGRPVAGRTRLWVKFELQDP